MAFVVVVEYNPYCEESSTTTLRETIQNHCLFRCGSRYRLSDPLLVFVGVETDSSLGFVDEFVVEDAVLFVRNTLRGILFTNNTEDTGGNCEDDLQSANHGCVDCDSYRPWFIQPISMSTSESEIPFGFLGGLNWLIRQLTNQFQGS
jgi:hypothetical protein